MKPAKFTRSDDICRCCARGAAIVIHLGGIFRRSVVHAARDGRAFVAECFVRYSLLDVVGLAGKDHQRFVLRFPAEPSDRAVVAAGVENAADTELRFDPPVRGQVGLQGRVRSGFHQTEPKGWSGNSENHVAIGQLPGEIRLLQSTSFSIRPTGYGVQAVHPAIGRTVGVADESGFPHRTIGSNKGRNGILWRRPGSRGRPAD